jgi:hypothetical protein
LTSITNTSSSINSSNNSSQEFTQIDKNLKKLGVTEFVKHGGLVQIIVNKKKNKGDLLQQQQQKDKIISFNIHKDKFAKTIEEFKAAALNGTAGLSREDVDKMMLILIHPDNQYLNFLQTPGTTISEDDSDPDTNGFDLESGTIRYATVYDYGDKLYEAVIIGNTPYFIEVELQQQHPQRQRYQKTNNKNSRVIIKPKVELSKQDNIIIPGFEKVEFICPLEQNMYLTRPYTFKSEEEFDNLVERVKKYETLDSLYQKVKDEWNLYVDDKFEHNVLCAGDTILPYFQDRLGTIHNLLLVGDNNTAKSSRLMLLNLLTYRNSLSTNMTSANMFQIFR